MLGGISATFSLKITSPFVFVTSTRLRLTSHRRWRLVRRVSTFSLVDKLIGPGGTESSDSRLFCGSVISVLVVSSVCPEKVSRSKFTNFGISNRGRALLILFLAKMLPKLAAATSGMFFARIAVAACSREL